MNLDVSAGAAFLGGLLSFVSPCVLPLVPAYLAFMSGYSIEQLTGESKPRLRWRGHGAALCFVAGFSAVFVALGATASVIGQTVTAYADILSYVAGALIVIMGLHFLHVLRIPWLDRTARFDAAQRPASFIGAFAIGIAFGFGWSPCVGPVLTAILLMAGAEESAGEGARLLLVYSLGIGVPFLIAAFFASGFMRLLARFKARLGAVEKIMGAFLVVAGVLIFTGHMATIAFWMIETFPVFGKIG